VDYLEEVRIGKHAILETVVQEVGVVIQNIINVGYL